MRSIDVGLRAHALTRGNPDTRGSGGYTSHPPRAVWSWQLGHDVAGGVGQTIIEAHDGLRRTGILDKHGNPVIYTPWRQPIGFIPLRERP